MQLKIAQIGISYAEINIPDLCPKCNTDTNKVQRSKYFPLLIRIVPTNEYSRVYEQQFVLRSDLPKYDKGIFQIICANRVCSHNFYSAFGGGSAVTTKEELDHLKELLGLNE